MRPAQRTARSTADPSDAGATTALLGGHAGSSSDNKPRSGAHASTFEVELYGGPNGHEEDDEMLLDWEHHNMRRWQLFGVDLTWAMRYVPERFHTPPDW